MPATIGNTTQYVQTATGTSHNSTLTLGSNSRRKVVVCVLIDLATNSVSTITIDGATPTARGDSPDVNPNDTALRMFWYDYDVPSGVGPGSININISSTQTTVSLAWHAWEVLDAADGAPESTSAGHAASGSNATTSVTSTTGAALIAGALAHASTAALTVTGDVVERFETSPANHKTVSADAGNVASGTRSVTITPSVSARNSVRLLSYAEFSGGGGSGKFRDYFITG